MNTNQKADRNLTAPESSGTENLKNFTSHLSPLEEEGRRNKPKDQSSKRTKKLQRKQSDLNESRKKELGALERFSAR
ncbi:MAG: hypothetical protein H7301_12145 [Cryobacterium sp.]|nr:hypothetical protein [Oligoflexia bacterium]